MEVTYEQIRNTPFLVNGHNPIDHFGSEMIEYLNTVSLAAQIKDGHVTSKHQLLTHLGNLPFENKLRAFIYDKEVSFSPDRFAEIEETSFTPREESGERIELATISAIELSHDFGLIVSEDDRIKLNPSQVALISGDYGLGERVPILKGTTTVAYLYFLQTDTRDLVMIDEVFGTNPIIWFEDGEEVGRNKAKAVLTRAYANYEHGGPLNGGFYSSEVQPITEELVVEAFEEIESEWELFSVSNSEVERDHISGFAPWTDGGWTATGYSSVSYLESTGKTLPSKKLTKLLEKSVNHAYELAREAVKADHPEISGLSDDDINYNHLYELGHGDVAEELSEKESDYMADTIMFEVGAYYYSPSNDRNDFEGEHSMYVYGVINMESPYHRRQNQFEDHVETKFTFKTKEELEEKLKSSLDKVLEFLGQKVLFESGGFINEKISILELAEKTQEPSELSGLKVTTRHNNREGFIQDASNYKEVGGIEVSSKKSGGTSIRYDAETLYTTQDDLIRHHLSNPKATTRRKARKGPEQKREPRHKKPTKDRVDVQILPEGHSGLRTITSGEHIIAQGVTDQQIEKQLLTASQYKDFTKGRFIFDLPIKRLAKIKTTMAEGGELEGYKIHFIEDSELPEEVAEIWFDYPPNKTLNKKNEYVFGWMLIEDRGGIRYLVHDLDADIRPFVAHITSSDPWIDQSVFRHGGITTLKESAGTKRFHTSYGIGKSKYVVSFHDGIKKHKDDSDFYDTRIFSNKKDLEKFERQLVNQGYIGRYSHGGVFTDLNLTPIPRYTGEIDEERFHTPVDVTELESWMDENFSKVPDDPYFSDGMKRKFLKGLYYQHNKMGAYAFDDFLADGGDLSWEEPDINQKMAIAKMDTADGEIEGTVIWNPMWNKYQQSVDGVIYSESDSLEKGVEELSRTGFKDIKIISEKDWRAEKTKAITLKYAKEDIDLLEDNDVSAITGTTKGNLWGEHSKGVFIFRDQLGEQLFKGNKQEAIEFVRNSYVVQYMAGGEVSQLVMVDGRVGRIRRVRIKADGTEQYVISTPDGAKRIGKFDASEVTLAEKGMLLGGGGKLPVGTEVRVGFRKEKGQIATPSEGTMNPLKEGDLYIDYPELGFSEVINVNHIKVEPWDENKHGHDTELDKLNLVYEVWSDTMDGNGVSGTIRTRPENYYVADVDEHGHISFSGIEANTRDIDHGKVLSLWENKEIPRATDKMFDEGGITDAIIDNKEKVDAGNLAKTQRFQVKWNDVVFTAPTKKELIEKVREAEDQDDITARNWWHTTLSSNMQDELLQNHAPYYYKTTWSGNIYKKWNNTIKEMWKKEGSPTYSDFLVEQYGEGDLTDKELRSKIIDLELKR